jgi:hypothetical protein
MKRLKLAIEAILRHHDRNRGNGSTKMLIHAVKSVDNGFIVLANKQQADQNDFDLVKNKLILLGELIDKRGAPAHKGAFAVDNHTLVTLLVDVMQVFDRLESEVEMKNQVMLRMKTLLDQYQELTNKSVIYK